MTAPQIIFVFFALSFVGLAKVALGVVFEKLWLMIVGSILEFGAVAFLLAVLGVSAFGGM